MQRETGKEREREKERTLIPPLDMNPNVQIS